MEWKAAIGLGVAGGILDQFRIASYLIRNDELHTYDIDSAVRSLTSLPESRLENRARD